MMHKGRQFSIANVEAPEALAEKLTNHTWCPCNGFRLGSLLFLNDSTSPDGAQEYAVVRESDGAQIESITMSWCTEAEALASIRKALEGAWTTVYTTVDVARALLHPVGCCHHCA